MKIQHCKLFLVFFTMSTISCSKVNKAPYLLPENAIELIAGTSGKTWKLAWRYNNGTRMNMRGCFLSYRVTYQPDMIVKDNNGEQENCGASLIGTWQIIKAEKGNSYIKLTSDQLPELMNIDSNHKFLKILQLHEDTIKIQFRHKQFSGKSTFVDTFVPEHVEVRDRDFHW